MLQRAIGNLLSNAIRHTPADGEVTVSLAATDSTGVRIVVANPGLQIEPEHLAKLFDRFYRVDPSRRRSGEGAGLGLSIVKSIVDAHGGTIDVRSSASATEFEINLPRNARSNSP